MVEVGVGSKIIREFGTYIEKKENKNVELRHNRVSFSQHTLLRCKSKSKNLFYAGFFFKKMIFVLTPVALPKAD